MHTTKLQRAKHRAQGAKRSTQMHTRNPRVEREAIRLANGFLVAAGLGCAAALLYVFYHYHWLHDRHFAGPAGRWLYYGLPALLTVLFFGSLRLKASRKIKFAFVSIVLATCLVVGELFLEGLRYISETWPSEITEETGPRRANIAERLGVSFDRRTRLQVIADLRKKGVDAVPASDSVIFQRKNPDGTLTWNVNWGGHQLYPLGGIANKTTVFCNENGTHTIYDSDEHGFHNPRGIWSRHPIDIAAVGDSFTHGACVPSDRNFVALIRKSHPVTLNLGVWANGPLSELATLIEYLPPLRPKLVLWLYFEGNDVIDLAVEKNNPVLMQYLEGDFRQHLLSRQAEIDQRIKEIVNRLVVEAAAREKGPVMKLVDSLVDFGTLSLLRQKLGLIYGKNLQTQTGLASELDPELLALLRRILLQGKNMVDRWHGSLYFVYLPAWERYAHPERAVKNREAVLQMVKNLTIPLIDVHPTFQARSDPLSLFPFRGFGHYNEAGHALVAQTVLGFIEPGGASPQFSTPPRPIPISAP
jgi:hypothetical protein